MVQDDPQARVETSSKAGASGEAQDRPQGDAPQRVLANRCESIGRRSSIIPKDSCLAGEREAELGHHLGAPHRGVKGPSGRLSDRERSCRHRRRFGELWRGRPAAPGFKFSASCARADRHHLLELLDRGVLATIEARVALPEHSRQCGGGAASGRVLRP